MNIGIDMRPFSTPSMGSGSLYCEDLLRALFRNHTSHVFFLWTTGSRKPKNLPTFEKYSNVKWIHTPINNKTLEIWIKVLDYPYIDDIIETQAMKNGNMAWTSGLDVTISLAPSHIPMERNGLKVQIIEHCSYLHFPELYSSQTQKSHKRKQYSREIDNTDLILVPSKFVKKDIVKEFSNADEEKITVIGAGVLLDFQSMESDEKTQDLLEKELFLEHQEKEEQTLEKEILPEKFFFTRGIEPHHGNTEQILKAYALFRARFVDEAWDMIIEEKEVGDLDDFPEIEGVKILPPLEQKERNRIFLLAQCFFYPAIYDGDGVSIIEAMRLKCPVICSRYGALPEIYRDSALHFEPFSEHSILKAMKNIFKQVKSKNTILIEKAFERSNHSRFQWDDIAMHMIHRIGERIEEKEDED